MEKYIMVATNEQIERSKARESAKYRNTAKSYRSRKEQSEIRTV